MSVFAAVMTGKGTGAIATIQISGVSAKAILEKIFKSIGKKSPDFKVGKICVGTITDGNQTIDQVTIGCEAADTFAINCHGNPLIVERVMQLLQKHKVELLTTEQLIVRTFTGNNTIALEAKLTLPKAKTIEGTKIILNQIDSGLTAAAKNWMKNADMKKNAIEAKNIIVASQTARLIILGCRIVLAGPSNTGKSTLLNQLCGSQKAIVTNIKGTTRDWVSANCRIGKLSVELIDTAGLNENFEDNIDGASQKATLEIITQADLVLLVLDNSEPIEQLTDGLIKSVSGKKVLTVINKSDLPASASRRRDGPCRFKAGNLANAINISAKLGTGIDRLCDEIQRLTSVANFEPNQPICFTPRQEQLLTQLSKAKSKEATHTLITELLSGRLSV